MLNNTGLVIDLTTLSWPFLRLFSCLEQPAYPHAHLPSFAVVVSFKKLWWRTFGQKLRCILNIQVSSDFDLLSIASKNLYILIAQGFSIGRHQHCSCGLYLSIFPRKLLLASSPYSPPLRSWACWPMVLNSLNVSLPFRMWKQCLTPMGWWIDKLFYPWACQNSWLSTILFSELVTVCFSLTQNYLWGFQQGKIPRKASLSFSSGSEWKKPFVFLDYFVSWCALAHWVF